MARADAIGSNPFSFCAFEVVPPRHSQNFGQLARDLDAEPENLESLGPADALGRAYAVELLLHPQNDPPRHAAERWFRLVGLVVVLSTPTIVAVSRLASVGISFVAGGLFAFVIGVLEALGIFP